MNSTISHIVHLVDPLKRQLISSSCCPPSELHGYEDNESKEKEQLELIDDDESEDVPVLNLNTQRASPQQKQKLKSLG